MISLLPHVGVVKICHIKMANPQSQLISNVADARNEIFKAQPAAAPFLFTDNFAFEQG